MICFYTLQLTIIGQHIEFLILNNNLIILLYTSIYSIIVYQYTKYYYKIDNLLCNIIIRDAPIFQEPIFMNLYWPIPNTALIF